ncbi:MAG: alpha-ketoglutarate-dependent dioxygenase AlkB [Xanthobacteraceae bacterium]
MSVGADVKHHQFDLFRSPEPPARPSMPEGFRYAPEVIDAAGEARLVKAFADLPFKEFEFHGFLGKRRVVSFGFRYDYNGGGLQEAAPMPPFLLPLRERAAAFAGLAPERLADALVTEYRPGTSIGWHRDRPHYDDVIGISLSSPCTFRMRRKHGTGWDRAALQLDPRSVYLMRGPSRWEWEHSIPAGDALRYSVTFRSMREGGTTPRCRDARIRNVMPGLVPGIHVLCFTEESRGWPGQARP